jgi:DNA-binding NarL/FixJ family response regulator
MAHILLIEGHRMMRGALNELLAQSGTHSIDSASDPLDAVQMVMRTPPEIILLDTSWTEINGVYLSRMLREMVPQAIIVLLVDEDWPRDEDLRHSSGADELVVKARLNSSLPALLRAAVPPDNGLAH